jgi:hypothetical protein
MRTRLFACLFSMMAAAVSGDALAVVVTVNDTCGQSMSLSTGATSSVANDGGLTLNQVTGSYTAGVGQCETYTAGDPPKCTLSASSTKTSINTSVTLYAKCNGLPSQYVWNGPSLGTGAPTLPANPVSTKSINVSFTSAGSYTYSVAATNGSGTGPVSAQVTVLVSDANAKPACVLTASPALVTAGGKSTLQVSCNPAANAATPYTWTADTVTPFAPAPPANTAAMGEITFPAAGTYTYRVKGTNAAGTGAMASAVVTAEAAPDAPCTPGPYQAEHDFMAAQQYSDHAALGAVLVYRFVMGVSSPYAMANFTMGRFTPGGFPDLPTTVQVAVSHCKGDFNVPPNCAATINVIEDGNFFQVYGPGYAATPTLCTATPGGTYYLNLKSTSCTWGTCSWTLRSGISP